MGGQPFVGEKDRQCAGVTKLAVAPVGLKMTRTRACNAVRCATAPQRQVQPVLVACGLGSGRLCSGIHRVCVRSRGASTLRPGERAATTRCDLGFRTVLSKRTASQVDQVPHTEAFADFAQLRAAGCKETAQQPISAELLQPTLPALGAPSQPLEDPRELRQDRSLSLAKEPAGVVDQFNPTPRNHRRPLRIYPKVPRGGSQSTSWCPRLPYYERLQRFLSRQCDGRNLRESTPPSQPTIRANSE